VNELKIEKLRWWLVFLLDDLPIGEEFQPSVLHLTIVPWFVVDIPQEEVITTFESYFSGFTRFKINICRNIKLGPRKVSVNLVEDDGQLHHLHFKALSWLEHIESRWAVKNPFVGENYKPHIRRRRSTNIKPGQTITINSLSLVKARRTEDGQRKVAARVSLQ
jgi:hypothetical protein